MTEASLISDDVGLDKQEAQSEGPTALIDVLRIC